MKPFAKVFLTIGIVLLSLFCIFWINGATAKCNVGHEYNKAADSCYYQTLNAAECKINGEWDGNYCHYYPEGFMSNNAMIWISVIIVVLGICFSALYAYNKGEKSQTALNFNKKKELDVDDAIKAVKKHWTKKYKIPYNIDKFGFNIKKGVFEEGDQEPFIKPNFENFVQFELKVNEGKRVGIFTIIINLNLKIEKILKGKYVIRNCEFGDYKESPSKRPMYQVEDPNERLQDALIAQGRTEEANQVMMSRSPQPQQEHPGISPEEMEDQRDHDSQMNDKRRVENRTRPQQRRKTRY